MLALKNYGGVWTDDFPVNKNWALGPLWFRTIRGIVKLVLYPISEDAWRFVERRAFFYYTDEASNMSIIPYTTALFSVRSFRNDFSWVAKFYIDRVISPFDKIHEKWR